MKNALAFTAGFAAAILLYCFNNYFASALPALGLLFNPVVLIFASLFATLILFTKTLILRTELTTRLAFSSLGALTGFVSPILLILMFMPKC